MIRPTFRKFVEEFSSWVARCQHALFLASKNTAVMDEERIVRPLKLGTHVAVAIATGLSVWEDGFDKH